MKIEVISVNIGTRQPIATKSGQSGIFKTPITHSVFVNAEGLEGDVICDRENHGGTDQAVYVYCQDDYDWWQRTTALRTTPGLFGENLTISGMSTVDAHIGARLVSDTVTLEITSPRTPCDTFAARMNDSTFPKRFWASRLTGFYCRVIQQGHLKIGESMQLQPYQGTKISIGEWIASSPLFKLDKEGRAHFLSVPLHCKARQELSS